jgi:hypothetical protein
MAVGHSDDVDVGDALDDVLGQCARTLAGSEPKAGLLFSTHETHPEPLIEGVREAYPGVELIGSTSGAEMSSVLGFQEGSIALALFASDTVDITGGLGTGLASDLGGTAQRAVREALEKTHREPRLCLTAPAPHPHPVGLLAGLREQLGDGVPILGGGSSATIDDPGAAYQFCNDRIVHDGVPVMVFSGALAYSFGVDHGWRPVGKRGRLTRVSDDVVHEIDGRPAAEFYRRYLGPGGAPALANPLAVFDSDSDHFYLRVVDTLEEATGSIVINGGAPVDATVQLTVAMSDEIFDGARSAMQKAVKSFPTSATPEAGLLFSCLIRRVLLGTKVGTEMDIARDELGELPLFGFYCYGEIAPIDSGSTQVHQETIVAVLLGEE